MTHFVPDIVLLKNLVEWDPSVSLFEHVGSLYYPLRLRPRVYCTPHTHVPLLGLGLVPGTWCTPVLLDGATGRQARVVLVMSTQTHLTTRSLDSYIDSNTPLRSGRRPVGYSATVCIAQLGLSWVNSM